MTPSRFFSPTRAYLPACTRTETFLSFPLRICDSVSSILYRRRLHLFSLRWAVSTLLSLCSDFLSLRPILRCPSQPDEDNRRRRTRLPARTRTLDALWLCLEPQDGAWRV